ncbi:hypothetical protein QQ045_028316 [Rhodiola kirilowii]
MNVVGKVGSLISQGVYSVATPFHPFGGAVDIIVVQQQDGSFRSTPWYVRFGKFQGVLKGAEKFVRINVNGAEANFHMYLDNSGEAYFVREVISNKDSENGVDTGPRVTGENGSIDNIESAPGLTRYDSCFSDPGVVQSHNHFERSESDSDRRFYEFSDELSPREDSGQEFVANGGEALHGTENLCEPQGSNSEVVLFSVDGHVLTAPISASDGDAENAQSGAPQFHLGPGEEADFVEGNGEFSSADNTWAANYINEIKSSTDDISHDSSCKSEKDSTLVEHVEILEDAKHVAHDQSNGAISPVNDSEVSADGISTKDIFRSCLELTELATHSERPELRDLGSTLELQKELGDSDGESSRDPSKAFGIGEDSLAKGHPDDNDAPSPCSSESPGSILSSELQLDAEPVVSKEHGADQMESDNASVQFSGDEVQYEDERSITTAPPDELISGDQERPGMQDECQTASSSHYSEATQADPSKKLEISLCGNELVSGMGLSAAAEAFNAHLVSEEEFKISAASIIKNDKLVVRFKGRYMSWDNAAPYVLALAAFGVDLPDEPQDAMKVEQEEGLKPTDVETPSSSGRRWRLWPNPFRRVKTLEHTNSDSSNEEVFVDSECGSHLSLAESLTNSKTGNVSPQKQLKRTNIPTSEQIASLNLKDGQNMVTFSFSTRVLGNQQVDAHIYLWKWNAKIVISDVDGTITKSDVLGQFMPLVGKDWTQSGVARLFCAIKENGYQLLFLSARAIVQAYLTRNFLLNLKQDGKTLPNGPVVISPDGLFPSLFREVIRRAPHEFKIACLQDIKALFPSDYNPFYAGFGNRDTDELSYRKIGIPKGKIFIINPKGEVAISHRIDVKSYTNLHTLVNDMFPPTSLVEQEDYNSWNYWKMPFPEIDES